MRGSPDPALLVTVGLLFAVRENGDLRSTGRGSVRRPATTGGKEAGHNGGQEADHDAASFLLFRFWHKAIRTPIGFGDDF